MFVELYCSFEIVRKYFLYLLLKIEWNNVGKCETEVCKPLNSTVTLCYSAILLENVVWRTIFKLQFYSFILARITRTDIDYKNLLCIIKPIALWYIGQYVRYFFRTIYQICQK